MIEARRYGSGGPHVILLHGGPGAPGHMAPIARQLQAKYRVIEPFQRPSGPERLTVRRHVEDLYEVVHALGENARPVLVGSSWGAMLGLAFAAAYPGRSGAIALIGCGTFDAAARQLFQENVESRLDATLRRQIERLDEDVANPDVRLREKARLLLPAYSHDLVSHDLEVVRVDARANRETWQDMLGLQQEGAYPRAFRTIRAPVLMLHGTRDPHPGSAIRDGLLPYVPQLEYCELADCGHYPWLERAARARFYEILSAWLLRVARGQADPTRER